MFFIVEKKGKFGVMDNRRKWIIKPQNYLIKYFDKDMGFIISDGLYYGIMDMQGKVIIKPQYEEIYKFSNRLYRVKKEDKIEDYKLNKNNKIGIINEKGEFVLEPKFDYINTDKYPFKFIQGAKYGFLDEKARILFEINFAYEDDFNNDILTLANKYWLVQKKAKVKFLI
ncbi:WG repeat-containing protein [Campylobacter sp. CCS1377]|uniref:WG repeat-containing protein n=1 Tax=Campylobacter sp. CCS1377 TaxID=3158229 RepID=A0AAU7E9C4_9BACT|nr:WG repeat-containing protein [Campylobacter jejuni]